MNLHPGKKAAVRPSIVFTAQSCRGGLVFYTLVGPCESGVGIFGRSENADGIVSGGRQMVHLEAHVV